jgi:flagellar hook protein FlgE
MLQALLASVASIKAQQTQMNVIGNNIANVNTTAYKGSRVTFEDMIAQTIRGASKPSAPGSQGLGGTDAIQYGLGVMVGGTDVDSSQGSLNATNRPSDIAIQGGGFLMTSNGQRTAFTRDGACDLDAVGNLVQKATGEKILGWTADPATGAIDTSQNIGAAQTIVIPLGQQSAVQVTTQATFVGNLNSQTAVTGPTATPPTPPVYQTATVRVYDKQGAQHDLTLQIYKSAPDTWQWSATSPGGETLAGSGTLAFDNNGQLSSGSPGSLTITPAAGGAAPFTVSLKMDGLTELATTSQVTASDQNGFPPGSLSSYSIGTDGVITGLYTNGLTRPLAQLAMAVFPNTNGLEQIGSNLWQETDNSGVRSVGTANTGGRGAVNAGYLEQSNVDISNEFTSLIVTQRGFQANTKVVTTVDQMLQDIIAMKQ